MQYVQMGYTFVQSCGQPKQFSKFIWQTWIASKYESFFTFHLRHPSEFLVLQAKCHRSSRMDVDGWPGGGIFALVWTSRS